MNTVDAMMPVLFLAALFLTRAARPALINVDLPGYRKLSAGISLLAGLSVINLYVKLHLITTAVGLIDSSAIEFIGWSGALLGVSLAASGVSSSMPLIRRHRQRQEAPGRNFEFLERVQEMADDETVSLDGLLSRSIRDMAATFNVESYAVFTFSQRARNISLSIVDCSDDATASQFCDLADFDKAAFLSLVQGDGVSLTQTFLTNKVCSVRYPDQMIPIKVQGLAAGYYIFWDGKREGAQESTSETANALLNAAEIVSRRIERDRLKLKADTMSSWTSLISRLNKQGRTNGSVSEMLPALHSGLSELIRVDTTIVVVLDLSSKKLNRFSVGKTGSVLLERNLAIPSANNATPTKEHDTGRVTIDNLGKANGTAETRRKLLAPYMSRGSLSSYGITINHNTIALVGYYSERMAAFTQYDQEMLFSLCSLIGEAVARESIHTGIRGTDSGVSSLRQLITGLSAVSGSQVELQSIASFLLRNNNIGAARISMLDGPEFLQSKALACRNFRSEVLPAGGTQVLSLMPGHQRTIKTGKPVLIGQKGAVDFCSLAEATQMLDSSVLSALICPIQIEGEIAGTLTLMSEDATGAPFRSPEMVDYMTAVSSLIGMSLTWQAQTPKSEKVASLNQRVAVSENTPTTTESDPPRIAQMRQPVANPYLTRFETEIAESIADSKPITSGYRSSESPSVPVSE